MRDDASKDHTHAHHGAPSERSGTPPSGDHAGDDGIDRVVDTVRSGIDQVAEKVKGLLRSDR